MNHLFVLSLNFLFLTLPGNPHVIPHSGSKSFGKYSIYQPTRISGPHVDETKGEGGTIADRSNHLEAFNRKGKGLSILLEILSPRLALELKNFCD